MIGTSALSAIFASAFLATASPGSATGPQSYDCPRDDTACLLASIDRKLDRLIELLERDQRRDRWDRDDDAPTQVDVPVNQSCGSNDCSTLAATVCQTAGFRRGMPKDMTPGVWGAYLTTATCMD